MEVMITRAYYGRKALGKMERAKVKADREMQGLPPLEKELTCCKKLRNKIRWMCLKTFCPCAIKPVEEEPKPSRCACKAKPCIDGTYENHILKSILGFIGGMVLSLLWFLLMVYNLHYSPFTATVTSSVIGLVLTLGLAFSVDVRCLTFLILPQLFSSKGRAVLLAMAFVLVLNGPMQNFRSNMHVMSETATCGQQMSQSATREIVHAALAPVRDIIDSIRSMLNALAYFAEKLREAVLKVRDLFVEVVAAVRRVFQWLDEMVNVCNDNMGQPYRKCVKGIEHGVNDCRRKLGPVNFLCEIAKAATHICHIAKIGELLCSIPTAIKDFVIFKIKSHLTIAINDVYEMFYFNVTLKYHYDLKLHQSKTYAEVKADIDREIEQRMRPFLSLVGWSNIALAVMLVWLIMKSVLYRRRYLSKDNADNVYLTKYLRDIDEKRTEANKECILPLHWKEGSRYIDTASLQLARHERRKLVVGLVFLVGSGVHIGFQLGLDYGLYWMLTMIRTHGELRVHNDVPSHLKMHVQGEGVLADIYRAIITQFDPVDRQQIGIDTTPCLPNPQTPDYSTYKTLAGIFGVCIFLVLTEAYGLRLRHIIAGSYYPERAKFRAVWLYNNILRRRGGFLKHMRRQMREDYQRGKAEEQFSMLSKLGAKFPFVNKLMKMAGIKQVYCLCCGLPGKPDDTERFKHCSNDGCKGLYCNECFTDINNLCTVCMRPVDYGDFSDFSEERDSSDEEGIDQKKLALLEDGNQDRHNDLDYTYQDKMKEEADEHDEEDDVSKRSARSLVERVSMEIFDPISNTEKDGIWENGGLDSGEDVPNIEEINVSSLRN